MIVLTPATAVDGSNTPLIASVIPVPDHVPPAVAAVRVSTGSFEQNGPTGVMLASGGLPTVTEVVLVSEQPLVVTEYVMVNVPTPAVAGEKVPATGSVMPVPLHEPPAVADVRLTDASVIQNGPAGVMVASGDAFTTIEMLFVSEHAPIVTV